MTVPGINFPQNRGSEFHFNNFLNSNQQKSFCTLDRSLKEIIVSQFLKSQKLRNLITVRLTLDIVASCSDTKLQRTVDQFFLTIFNAKSSNDGINVSLGKLRKICRLEDGANAFFKCCSTKKVNYYAIKTLKEIIDRFFECLQLGPPLPLYLRNLPCYNEGGKGFLAKLIENPSLGDKALEWTTSSILQVHYPRSLNDLLVKNTTLKSLRILVDSYLSSLPEVNRLKKEIYDQFFNFIQRDPKINTLKEEEKCEILKITLVATSDQHCPVLQHYSFTDLKEMAEEAVSIRADYGEEVLMFFCEGLTRQKRTSLDETIQAMKFLHEFSQDIEKLNDIQTYLENFQKGRDNLKQFIKNLEQLVSVTLPPLDNKDDIKALMKRFKGDDPNVKFPLNEALLNNLEKRYLQIQMHCNEWQHCRMSELVNKAYEIRQKNNFDEVDLNQLVAIGRLALRIKFFPIYLHPTQVLTVLGLLEHQKGCISQVKTGEGKSMIVALMAFVLIMQKRDVHIISSSQPLAIRDQNKFSSFFEIFDINSSHICRDKRIADYFDANLLYGTANDYEFAIMEEMLYFSKLFPRPFENTRAIIDEVDNLTIDTALNAAHFAYPAEITSSWVYLPILKFLQQNINKNEKQKVASHQIMVQLKSYLQNYHGGQFKKFVDDFSDKKLQKWISSGYQALYELEENKHYIIEDLQTSKGVMKLGIVIIDAENTGKRMEGCRWSCGVHEFVELKHHIEVEDESITPITMSHPVFYPIYPVIYGLTGTIGSESERNEIKEIYGIDSFDVPTHKPSLRRDDIAVILPDNTQHIQAILGKISLCRQQERPILVLCETIDETLILEKKLKTLQVPHEIFNEKQIKNEDLILENAGLPGAVTIATNNAGRGTDIKLKGSSLPNGGLHVLISFYPKSLRVEEQARGRAGRQGEPGSSEILLSAQSLGLKEFGDLNNPEIQKKLLIDLANERKSRGNVMKHNHVCRANLERFCFTFMKRFYHKLERFHTLLENDRFLRESSKTLSNRLFNMSKPDFSVLRPKDRHIAEEVFNLFQEAQVDPMQWVVILNQVIRRIKEKIINDWSIQFIIQVEEIMSDSKIHPLGSLKEMISQVSKQHVNQASSGSEELLLHLFFLNQEQEIINAMNEELKSLKVTINRLHDKLSIDWDKVLDINGVGINDYLGHLLGIKLLTLRQKSDLMVV